MTERDRFPAKSRNSFSVSRHRVEGGSSPEWTHQWYDAKDHPQSLPDLKLNLTIHSSARERRPLKEPWLSLHLGGIASGFLQYFSTVSHSEWNRSLSFFLFDHVWPYFLVGKPDTIEKCISEGYSSWHCLCLTEGNRVQLWGGDDSGSQAPESTEYAKMKARVSCTDASCLHGLALASMASQVAELREELKKLGEKTTGRKAELVERLARVLAGCLWQVL